MLRTSNAQEHKGRAPRRHSTLETIPRKWERIQVDAGDWTHPVSGTKFRFVLFIDEGSRFRTGQVLAGDPREAGNWEDIQKAYEQVWLANHGAPAVVRVDPAGAWRSHKADEYFAEWGIMLEPIPAEAHWQIGIVERAIRSVKSVMDVLAPEFPEMSHDELFTRSMWIGNSRDPYKGFSPLQHAAGRTPDEEMRMFESTDEKPLNNDIFGFGQNIRAMCLAEKAFIDEQAKQRIIRAQHMRQRKFLAYAPGDLVYYWRRQQAGKTHKSFPRGRFLGPARVLATESHREEDGTIRPGAVVWLHRGGHLLRAAPEQLRPASPREVYIHEIENPAELPRTFFSSLATDSTRRTYVDISTEKPDEMEWEEAADQGPLPPSQTPKPSRRITAKRPAPSTATTTKEKGKEARLHEARGTKRDPEELPETTSPRRRIPAVGRHEQHPPTDDEQMNEEVFAAVEIHVDMPTSKRGMKKFIENPTAYFCQKLKRKQVEVHEKNLTAKEREEFEAAKSTEVLISWPQSVLRLGKVMIYEKKMCLG